MRLQILGGGNNQLGAIRRAAELGHEVVLVDYLKNPPGRIYAAFNEEVSTFDVKKKYRTGEYGHKKTPACGAFWGYIQRLFTFKFFHFFLLGFAVDAFGSDRSGQQSFFGNRSAAGFAHAVCSVVDSFNGFLHFDNEFALTVADAQLKITVGFQRGAIIGIRKIFLAVGHFRDGFACLTQQFIDFLGQQFAECLQFFRL